MSEKKKKEKNSQGESTTEFLVRQGKKAAGANAAKRIVSGTVGAFLGKRIGQRLAGPAGMVAGTLLFPEELGDGSLPRFETPEQAWSHERRMADFRRKQEEEIRAEEARKAARKKEEEALSRETAAQREKRQMQEARNRAQEGTARIMQQHEAKKREKAAREQEQRNAMRGHPTIHIPD